jgi:DNA-binding transcriptional regulator YhcF (GntR family)
VIARLRDELPVIEKCPDGSVFTRFGITSRLLSRIAFMPDPLHQQIAGDLRAKIESGVFAPGERLKSQRELSAEYAKIFSRPVSANAIRAAAAILISDGLVEVRQGKGTFVSAQAGRAYSVRPRIGQARAWPWNWDIQTAGVFSFAGMQPYLWLSFFSSRRDAFTGSGMVVVSILLVVSAIGILLVAGDSAPATLLGLVYTLSALTYLFSTLYWGYGEAPNFSTSLTRLDSIYFSVGTLTTAGTGNISATSELSRGLQTAQMILGFVLVVFVVAIVIPRLTRPAKSATVRSGRSRSRLRS